MAWPELFIGARYLWLLRRPSIFAKGWSKHPVEQAVLTNQICPIVSRYLPAGLAFLLTCKWTCFLPYRLSASHLLSYIPSLDMIIGTHFHNLHLSCLPHGHWSFSTLPEVVATGNGSWGFYSLSPLPVYILLGTWDTNWPGASLSCHHTFSAMDGLCPLKLWAKIKLLLVKSQQWEKLMDCLLLWGNRYQKQDRKVMRHTHPSTEKK